MPAVAALVLCTSALGCGDGEGNGPAAPAASFDRDLAARLEARLDQSRQQYHALGAAVAAQSADGAVWFGVSGSARADQSVALTTTDRFRVASATKMFTAALIFRAVEERQLRLSDTLDTWYPSVPFARAITIRMLLDHTSGIPDDHGLVDEHQHWEPDAVIGAVVAGGTPYPPGSRYSYSNTNYFLLARIIEKTTSSSYRTALRARILEPLHLDQTFLEGEEDIPDGFVQGTRRRGDAYEDITGTIDPSLLWAAGGLVSSAPDLLRWLQALFGGRVLAPESLAAMTTPAVLNDGTSVGTAGAGVDIARLPAGVRYGHLGNINGFASSAFALPDRRLALVVLTNNEKVGWFIAEDLWMVLAPQ